MHHFHNEVGKHKENEICTERDMKKTYYYKDELRDDFAKTGGRIHTKPLREKYRYVHRNPLWRTIEFVLYRIIVQPIIFLYVKIAHGQRFRGRRAFKAARASGAYLYSNHTGYLLDAFCPNLACWHKHNYIVVGPDAMSIPGLNNIVEMAGAIPMGSSISQTREMVKCIQYREKHRGMVTIFPEAHIWPYYTDIRPFPDNSFRFPAMDGNPVYALTNCYTKRAFFRRPRVISYIDGPFYADPALTSRENQKMLRDRCYQAMKMRTAENSDYEYARYVRAEDGDCRGA